MHGVSVTGWGCVVRGISSTTGTGEAGYYRAFHTGAPWTTFDTCYCINSSGYGFCSAVSNYSRQSIFLNCTVYDSDGWAFHLSSNYQRVIGCSGNTLAGGASSGVYLSDTYADGCTVTGNNFEGSICQIDGGCNFNLITGNTYTGGYVNNGASNIITNNLIY